jgi:hypothetical protein
VRRQTDGEILLEHRDHVYYVYHVLYVGINLTV